MGHDSDSDVSMQQGVPQCRGALLGGPSSDPPSWELHGDPLSVDLPLKRGYKIQGHHQYNTLACCWVQLAVQRYSNATPSHSRAINLFGIPSSQEGNDDGNTLPPHCHKHNRKRVAAHDITNICVPCRSITGNYNDGDYSYDGSLLFIVLYHIIVMHFLL